MLYGIGGDFKGFDPIQAGDVESADQVSRVYEGLLEYAYLERPYKAIPCLAEAMPVVSADGLIYTFKLKKGVRFMDDPCFPDGKGREVTAEDFVYSFKRLMTSSYEAPGTWIFSDHVIGAQEWLQGTSELKKKQHPDFSKPLDGFVAPDRYTLVIRLKQPYPQLIWVLTMPYAFVVPREAVEFYGDRFAERAVGTGPFRLKKWRRNYSIEYVRNETFHGQTYPSEGEPGDREAGLLEDAGKPLPVIERIVEFDVREYYTQWQMFMGGQIFSSGVSKDNFEKVITPQLDVTEEMKKLGIRLYKRPALTINYIPFNMRDPVVGTSADPVINERHKKLRQAFAMAIDVESFIKYLLNGRGVAARSPIAPGVAGATKKPYVYAYNLERAKQLLTEAGYPNGRDSNGRPLRLNFLMAGAGSTDSKQQGDFIAEQISRLGIELAVRQTTFPEYLRITHDGEYQVCWAGWVIDYPDAQNILQLLYGPNKTPGVNTANYENAEFDRLYRQILSMQDSPERTALYEKMAEIALADAPWALMHHPLTYGLFHPWFQNFKPHDFPYANWKYFKVLQH